MYGDQRVLTCEECGTTGPDVQPVTVDGQRRPLCPTHNHDLLRGDQDCEASDPARTADTQAAPADDDRVDDLLTLFRLQTLKRGRDSWAFEIDDIARDLRVEDAAARRLLTAAQARQQPFAIAERDAGGYVVTVGGGADV
jgi:hypothetical protein